MNILLIGNGFDLAHGLPTTYKDFLLFAEVIKQIVNGKYNEKNIEWKNISPKIRKLIHNKMRNSRDNIYSQIDSWKELLDNNFWIEYFLNCQSYINENWIDFENEISKVIQAFSECINKVDTDSIACRNTNNSFLNDFFISDTRELEKNRHMKMEEEIKKSNLTFHRSQFIQFEEEYKKNHPLQTLPPITYKEIVKRLEDDLNKLVIALEIYLADYVDTIDVIKTSPDIKKL